MNSPVIAKQARNRRDLAKRLADRVLDLIFPRDCIHCHTTADDDAYRFLCSRCAALLIRTVDPRCPTCGYPYWGKVEGLRICHHCDHLNPVFQQGRTLWIHRGVSRTVMHHWKYRLGRFLDADIMTALREDQTLAGYLQNKIIVPVPLHRKRERHRGFNQAKRLAGLLIQIEPTLRQENILERVRDTPTQTRLDRTHRLKNVRNAFTIKAGRTVDPAACYLLVDDVFTTGATLNECAKVLREAGANRIDVFTLAHG
jgi:competence protein ComFC